MDGPSFVTQCPLVPNEGFLYDFKALDQAVCVISCLHGETLADITQGTYWYHSHFKTQYCDGLRGPMVIYDEHDPHRDLYDIDDGKRDEEIFFHLAQVSLQRVPLSPLRIGITTFRLKVPRSRESDLVPRCVGVDVHLRAFNSTLINGKGRYPGGPAAPLAVVNVEQGKRSVLCLFLGFMPDLICVATLVTGSAWCQSPATPASSSPLTATN